MTASGNGSLVECSNAFGQVITPFIIFKFQTLKTEWSDDHLPRGSKIAMAFSTTRNRIMILVFGGCAES